MTKYFIETFGCQMNKYDSELVAAILEKNGYEKAMAIEESEIILINTCSVREHAENRVRNKLDAYRSLKKNNQNITIGVLGCMAERLGNRLIEEKPLVDFVLGPDSYRKLPQILADLEQPYEAKKFQSDPDETYAEIDPSRNGTISAWVAVMRGCNNYCSYCIVPYVRGRERSRPVANILNEIIKLVAAGYLEVTLLGQNVNSYRDNGADFADLIARVSRVPGIRRVRFATSHPKDLSQKLIEAIANSQTICHHFHLPVQSGSNSILKLMNRHYTREHYLSLIELIRSNMPDTGIYTDIIVGFPGETEKDFLQTYDLVKEIRFDGIFSFNYSPREGTAACTIPETVSNEEKKDRLQRLNLLQKEITLSRNRQLIGTVQKILIEGADKKGRHHQLMGRTDSNKITVFKDNLNINIGSLIDVKIVAAEGHTLFGEII